MSESGKRIEELDILKGFGILLMVADHVNFGARFHQYVQAFHMPLFFIVSGYLWKKRTVREEAERRFFSLLLPFLTFGILYLLLNLLVTLPSGTGKAAGISEQDLLKALLLFPTDMPHMTAPAMWFLPCMFWTDLFYTVLAMYLTDFRIRTAAVFLLTAVGIIYSHFDLPMLPFSLEPVLTALFFWWCGGMFRRLDLRRKVFRMFHEKWWIFALLILVWGILTGINPVVDMRSARYEIGFLYLLNAVGGTLIFWYGAAYLSHRFRHRKCLVRGYLKNLSQNAMLIICTNQVLIHLFPRAGFGQIRGYLWHLIVLILVLVLVQILNGILMPTKFRYLMGKRPPRKELSRQVEG